MVKLKYIKKIVPKKNIKYDENLMKIKKKKIK